MKSQQSIASMLIFIGAVLCFFLPFVTVSCGGVKAFTLSGQQLATGTTITGPQTQKIDNEPLAAIAGLCALAGIAFSVLGRKMAVASAVSGGVGALALLILRSHLDSEIQKQGGGMAAVSYEAGYVLALLLLIAGMAWNVYLFLQGRRAQQAGPSASTAGTGDPGGTA